MQSFTSSDTHPDSGSSRLRLGLRLPGTPGFQTILLESACILRPRLKHRLDFGTGRAMEAALAPEVALLVRDRVDLLQGTAPTCCVFPGVMLAEPGLVLADAEIEAAAADPDGFRRLTITFGQFVGRLQALFSATVAEDVPTLTHREAISVRTLEEVAIPLLDLAAALTARAGMEVDAEAAETLERRLSRIAVSVEALRHHTELLRRYAGDFDEEITQFVDTRLAPHLENSAFRRQ